MSKTALVTGCAGFIGHHLVARLKADGWFVVGIDNLSVGKRENVPSNIDHFFIGNVGEIPVKVLPIANYIRKFDCVFHLAAVARVQPSFLFPEVYLRNNLEETWNLLNWCRDNANRIVFASSSSVYGGTDDPSGSKEDAVAAPQSPYAYSKWMGEELMRMYAKCFGLQTACTRFFNVYGARMSTGAYPLVIKKFMDLKKEGKPFTINGDGTNSRDFTHVSDVVEALVRIGSSEKDELMNGQAWNVGAGNPQTVLKIAELVGGKDYPLDFGPSVVEPKHSKANTDKIKADFGWEAKINIIDGMKDIS